MATSWPCKRCGSLLIIADIYVDEKGNRISPPDNIWYCEDCNKINNDIKIKQKEMSETIYNFRQVFCLEYCKNYTMDYGKINICPCKPMERLLEIESNLRKDN